MSNEQLSTSRLSEALSRLGISSISYNEKSQTYEICEEKLKMILVKGYHGTSLTTPLAMLVSDIFFLLDAFIRL